MRIRTFSPLPRLVVALSLFASLAFAGGFPLASATSPPPVGPGPLESAGTGGIGVVERALTRLATHRRLMVVAAHPDDEDTTMLTLIARDQGGEAAYLSMSRGEGGQNLIGPELGVGLGLIRSRELLAARQIDGARQYFTRGFDFGYTRSLDETFQFWPKGALLEDSIRVIRRFRPQVIVSVFQGIPHPNHGQHQAAGATAYSAFRAAGDAAAQPQLTSEGFEPWRVTTLFRSTWFDDKSSTVRPQMSAIDPITGKSILQIASGSRSQHRSQDMGRIQELGPRTGGVAWVAGGTGDSATTTDLFSGVDTRPRAMVAQLADGERKSALEARLDHVQTLATETRRALAPSRLADAAAPLAEILRELRAVRSALAPNEKAAIDFLDEKITIAEHGLAAAAGVALDVWTERETLNPGESFSVAAALWSSGTAKLEGAKITLTSSPDWGGGELGTSEEKVVEAGQLVDWKIETAVPQAAIPTIPYFLRKPLQGALYDWSEVAPEIRGEPFEPAPLFARFRFVLAGEVIEIEREVVSRTRDQALGEIRRPIRVVPPVEVVIAEERWVWPLAEVGKKGARRLKVELISRSRSPLEGKLEALAPSGWAAIAPVPFHLERDGESRAIEITVELPEKLASGSYPLKLAAVLDGPPDSKAVRRSEIAIPILDYPHIRPTPQPRAATIEIRAIDVQLPRLASKIGYLRGASDRVPEFLRQVGVPLEVLSGHEIAEGDLSRFSAIVVGSRAYETDAALGRANDRLLDYARRGGLVIVQYQQYAFVDGKYAPFPLTIERPHDRVTDENAPVRILDPTQPAVTTPNAIREQDWKGWVQERGLYHPRTWDPAYTPILAMLDPGQPETQGAILVAKVGEGTYVYTGIAFFRQLPAGVEGAYRLFANLLALGGRASAKK